MLFVIFCVVCQNISLNLPNNTELHTRGYLHSLIRIIRVLWFFKDKLFNWKNKQINDAKNDISTFI